MSVKIRMSRQGRRHRPFFRINVIDIRSPRDGRIIEKLGHYDPLEKTSEKEIVLDLERVKYWLDKGAIPSDTVSEILLRKGIKHKYAEERKTKRALARKRARAAGLPFLKSERKTEEKPAKGSAAPAAETKPQT
jgi:small subunit ribosomal protein S16